MTFLYKNWTEKNTAQEDAPRGVAHLESDILFNQKKHLLTQNSQSRSFYWMDAKERVLARIGIGYDGSKAFSPFRSPFAGLEVAESMQEDQIDSFLSSVLDIQAQLGVSSLYFKQIPHFYDPNYVLVHQALLRHGFKITQKQICHYLPIQGDFMERISPDHRRRIEKSIRSGLEVVEFSARELPVFWKCYTQFQENKGYAQSITLIQVQQLVSFFPDRCLFLGVKDGQNPTQGGYYCAVAFFIRCSRSAYYYFLAASDKNYNNLSPSLLLMEVAYSKMQEEKFKLIDLGLSMDPKGFNQSLSRFKENLGGIRAERIHYEWTLE